jgi:predicted nucleotidyltransferase component of viral defense system
MIDADEIDRRARCLGLRPNHVWKDYVLNHILAAAVDVDASFVFRGGTALARAYWPDFRLSEDLDFITELGAHVAEDILGQATDIAARRSGFSLVLESGRPKDDWARSFVRWEEARIVVDVNGRERPAIEVQPRKLDLPYSDLKEPDREILVLTIDEILGNKWFLLDEREEPRDLFDIWCGLCLYEVPFDTLADGHLAKYGFLPQGSHLKAARRLQTLWETRLDYQVADLPHFEKAFGSVRRKFEEWQERARNRDA